MAFGRAGCVVAVLTGDDLAQLRKEFQNEHDPEYEKKLTPQARPNVLFEAGMAFGRDPDRTIMVQIGPARPFSDVAGRHIIQFTGTAKHREELRQRLRTVGCPVNEAGTDWLEAGDFEAAVAQSRVTKA